MGSTRRLFKIVAEAALGFTVASWAVVFLILTSKSGMSIGHTMGIVAVVVVPDLLATWWIFRKVQASCPRNDARRAATAFAVSAPVTLAVGYLLGEMVGAYAEGILGSHFIIPAIVVFIALLMVVIPGSVVAWALHPSGGIGPVGESGQNEHR